MDEDGRKVSGLCEECKAGVSCVTTRAGVPPLYRESCRAITTTQRLSAPSLSAQVSVCLWCAVAVYYVEERESLPIHFTNASLTPDISSKLELSF